MVVLIASAVAWIGCEDPNQTGYEPRQGRRADVLDPIDFDNCVSQFADAMRRWPVVDQAAAPVKLAYPEWRNRSGESMPHAEKMVGEIVQAINLRTGAKVRIAETGAVGCHYATELSLAPAEGPMAKPVLAMTWSVMRPGTRASLIESIVPIGRKPADKDSPGDKKAATTKPASLFGPPPKPAPPSYHVIRYEGGRLHLDKRLADGRVVVLSASASRDAGGQLCVRVTLLGRDSDVDLRLSAAYRDRSGKHHEVKKATPCKLISGKPESITVVLPRRAEQYVVFVTQP